MEEQFTPTHHKIISALGTILSSLGANSGIMALVMSWGDTQDSEATLEMMEDYVREYIKNPTTMDVKPFDTIREAIQKDPDYAWSWHCNLAMPIHDSVLGISRKTANKAAARIMSDLFGVDMEMHPNYEYQAQPLTPNPERIFGTTYKLWRAGNFIGTGIWTEDKNVGNSFQDPVSDEMGKITRTVYFADQWVAINK